MAKAGFVYTPQSAGDDTATCFYCELALSGWEEGDDPLYVVSISFKIATYLEDSFVCDTVQNIKNARIAPGNHARFFMITLRNPLWQSHNPNQNLKNLPPSLFVMDILGRNQVQR